MDAGDPINEFLGKRPQLVRKRQPHKQPFPRRHGLGNALAQTQSLLADDRRVNQYQLQYHLRIMRREYRCQSAPKRMSYQIYFSIPNSAAKNFRKLQIIRYRPSAIRRLALAESRQIRHNHAVIFRRQKPAESDPSIRPFAPSVQNQNRRFIVAAETLIIY